MLGAGRPEKRLTFLVNWWDKMPMEPYCRPLSDVMLIDMIGKDGWDSAAAGNCAHADLSSAGMFY